MNDAELQSGIGGCYPLYEMANPIMKSKTVDRHISIIFDRW